MDFLFQLQHEKVHDPHAIEVEDKACQVMDSFFLVYPALDIQNEIDHSSHKDYKAYDQPDFAL